MSDRPSLSSATVTNLKAYHPEIPAEKLGSMFARTIVGGLFVFAGIGLVFLLVALPAWTAFRAHTQPSFGLVTLGFGVGLPIALVLLGAQTWSSQLVAKPLALTIATFRSIWQTVRGTSGS